jgi:pimeloyl-ACP methyl ester carboxylesterase
MQVLDDVLLLGDGRRLRYRVRGVRDGVPVLYFHGQPGSRLEANYFDDATLAAAGATIIAFDRPGMGGSDLVPARDMVDDLPDAVALLDHLGIDRVGVIGVSAGGPWAFAFAASVADRVTRLVPISASGPYDDEAFMHDEDIEEQRELRDRGAAAMLPDYEAARARILADVPAEMARWFGDFPGDEGRWATQGPGRAMLADDMLEALRQGARGWLRETEVRARPWSFDPATIGCPVRAFHGDRDSLERLANVERILAVIPDARLTVLEGGDHLAPLLHPAWLLAAALGDDGATPTR